MAHKYRVPLATDRFRNIEASKALKKLLDKPPKNTSNIIESALRIYHTVRDGKDGLLMHHLLRIFLQHKQPEQCAAIWADLHSLLDAGGDSADTSGIHRLLWSLQQCCLGTHKLALSHCLQCMAWLQRHDYRHENAKSDSFMLHLVDKYKHHMHELQLIHTAIENGSIAVENMVTVDTALINAYARCQRMDKALQMFEAIAHDAKDSVLINTMMTAYLHQLRHDDAVQALALYDAHAAYHDIVSHILAIKACAACDQFERGRSIHAQLQHAVDAEHSNGGVRQYQNLQAALIHFYAHFKDVKMVQQLFEAIAEEHRNVNIINAAMQAWLSLHHPRRALHTYDTAQLRRNEESHILALKACIHCIQRNNEDDVYIQRGRQICGKLEQHVQQRHPKKRLHQCVIALIRFYAHTAEVDSALRSFELVRDEQKTAALVNAMMKAYTVNDDTASALRLYWQFIRVNDDFTHLVALKACIQAGDFEHGRRIHAHMDEGRRQAMRTPLKNTLMDFYGHSGDVATMMRLFEHGDVDNTTLNICMKQFIEHGQHETALHMFDAQASLRDETSFMYALKACGPLADMSRAAAIIGLIDDRVLRRGGTGVLSSALIDFYGRCGEVDKAVDVYRSLEDDSRNAVVLNAMLTVHINAGQYSRALELYHAVMSPSPTAEGLPLCDDVSHLLALNACTHARDSVAGKQIIANAMQRTQNGRQQSMAFRCSVVDFYGSCGELQHAIEVFDTLETQSLVDSHCVGCMMKAYLNGGQSEHAMQLYGAWRVCHNDVLRLLALRACAHLNAFERGQAIIMELTIDNCSTDLQNAMIEFYAHFADIKNAEKTYETIEQNANVQISISTIRAMLSAYYYNKLYAQCIVFFKTLQIKEMLSLLDCKCFCLLFKACVDDIGYGQRLHAQLKQENDAILADMDVQSSLIAMYGKNGMLHECESIFEQAVARLVTDISIWNAMINAYAIHGHANQAIKLFDLIVEKGELQCDVNTFTFVINALGHSGSVDEAVGIWRQHIDDENIELKYNVYIITSLIDAMARKGELVQAMEFLEQYERVTGDRYEDLGPLIALLSGCVKYQDVNLAEQMYGKIDANCRIGGENKHVQTMNEVDLLMARLDQ